MTEEEAIKVLMIMMTADNGCPYCAGALAESFAREFPHHEDAARKVFRHYHEGELRVEGKEE